MNRTKHHFLPLCIGIALAICALGTLFSAKGWFAPLTEGIRFVTYPARILCNRAADGLLRLWERIGGVRG